MTKFSWSKKTDWVISFDHEKIFTQSWKNSHHPKINLVFIHGLAGDHSAYESVIKSLLTHVDNLKCISFDLRGHGLSSYVFSDQVSTLAEQYAQDLAAICRYYSLQKPILVGQSFAGMIIQTYMESQQTPIPEKQILISSGLSMPSIGLSPQWTYHQLVSLTHTYSWNVRTRNWEDHQKYQGSWDYSPRRIWTDIYFTQPLKYACIWLAAFGWKAKQPYVCNQPATTYMYGNKDVVIPPFIQQRFLQKLPQVRAIEINSNHNAIVNSPELVGVEIKKILSNRR